MKQFEERKYVLIAGVLFIAIVFIIRLFWIQVVDDRWKVEAANMAEKEKPDPVLLPRLRFHDLRHSAASMSTR